MHSLIEDSMIPGSFIILFDSGGYAEVCGQIVSMVTAADILALS